MMVTPIISFVMSQFLGLYMLVIAVVMLSRASAYRQLVQKMDPQSGTIVLGGMIGLLLGMGMVGLHNVWVLGPVVLLTVISWLVLILSVLWLSSPERMVMYTRQLFSGSGFYAVTIFMAVLGGFMLARGVYLYATHQHNFLFITAG